MGIASDMAALGRIEQRFAGTVQERKMLDAVRTRLASDVESRVEGFVGHPSPLLVLGIHGVLMSGGGLVGVWWPQVGALVCFLTLASLVAEGTGRLPLLRWWLSPSPSYNLVVPPRERGSLGTLVLTTPLDVPKWRMWRPVWLRRPVQGVLGSSGLIASLLLLRSLAEPWGTPLLTLYVGSLVVMIATAALVFVSRREPRSVRSDAGGLAAVLELERRLAAEPLPGVETWVVFTGCGRAHQDGMRHFLSLRGHHLPEPVLVLSLNDAGRAPIRAVVTEGPLWPQHHRPTGPALIERLRWAGVRVPYVDSDEPTDARAAMIMGYRALAFQGGDRPPEAAAAEQASDIVEAVARWFADDLARLADDRPSLQALAESVATPWEE